MARPRLPIGSHGTINVREVEPGMWRARTRYRFSNGEFKQVERFSPSRVKAEIALKKALETIDDGVNASISPDLKLADLADKFLEEKKASRAAGTAQTYEVAVRAHVKPDIGQLTIREATPERLGRFLTTVNKEHGHGAAKNCRSVLSGMMALAVRNGALNHNPVADVEKIEKPHKPGSKPIPPEKLKQCIRAIESDEVLARRGYVDLFKFLAATGWRMSEACGLQWSAVDFNKGELKMTRIAKYINGEGTKLQEYGKTYASVRTIQPPAGLMELLAERRKNMPPNDYNLVFPSSQGGVLDPNNAERAWRERRDALGFPGTTSHSFRKCVATFLDAKGMSARDIADYLGHDDPSLTMDVYMQRNRGNAEASGHMNDFIGDMLTD